MPRNLSYFVSDVHLGLQVSDPAGREARFVSFLRDIPAAETEALYLLGDIWDFWYEYRDVVPKGYTRVFAALQDLMDAGVKVFFFEGNHDIWTYHYFEELGMVKLAQPYVTDIGGRRFCLGHGDGLGEGDRGWSRRSRLGKSIGYSFKGEDEPLFRFCAGFNAVRAASGEPPVDFFLFGHYHCEVDLPVGESRLLLLGDWISVSNWLVFDASSGALSRQRASY